MKRKKYARPYSEIARAIREAAANGNQFAQCLIDSSDYFTKKASEQHKRKAILSLQQKIKYTKNERRRKRFESQLKRISADDDSIA